jgi:hypothetical protein
VYEIDGFIDEYAICSNFIIILTGEIFLAKRLKIPYLPIQILESLNQTFQYKIKND